MDGDSGSLESELYCKSQPSLLTSLLIQWGGHKEGVTHRHLTLLRSHFFMVFHSCFANLGRTGSILQAVLEQLHSVKDKP